MKKLTEKFLNEEKKQRIVEAVQEVEKRTSGEIVPVIVNQSYHYTNSTLIGIIKMVSLLSFLLFAAFSIFNIILSKEISEILISTIYIGIAIFITSILSIYIIALLFPRFKLLFISQKETKEEVEEGAVNQFYKQAIFNTRDKTGILIYISLLEKRVVVLADKGINEKVPKEQWSEIVTHIATGLRKKQGIDAICEAIKSCGKIVEKEFPIKKDDTNELKDIIVE